jgi:hypothetical protein
LISKTVAKGVAIALHTLTIGNEGIGLFSKNPGEIVFKALFYRVLICRISSLSAISIETCKTVFGLFDQHYNKG